MHNYDFQTKVVQSKGWLSVTKPKTPDVLDRKGEIKLAPLSYPVLLDLTLMCHGQQPRPYEVSI